MLYKANPRIKPQLSYAEDNDVPVAVVGFMLLCMPFVNIWRMQKNLLICPQSLVEKDLSGKTFVVTGKTKS